MLERGKGGGEEAYNTTLILFHLCISDTLLLFIACRSCSYIHTNARTHTRT